MHLFKFSLADFVTLVLLMDYGQAETVSPQGSTQGTPTQQNDPRECLPECEVFEKLEKLIQLLA